MAYFLNLFTVETWKAFQDHGSKISGFRNRQRHRAQRIKPEDLFLCYFVGLSRWCGVLQIVSESYRDDTPIFQSPDPYEIRFKVKPIIVLEQEYSIPMLEDEIWNSFSWTKDIEKGSRGWGNHFRGSLREISDVDGSFLVSRLKRQKKEHRKYPFTEKDRRYIARRGKVFTLKEDVLVEIPDNHESEDSEVATVDIPTSSAGRQSLQIQAKVAEIGARMGFHIWIPPHDKVRVLENISDSSLLSTKLLKKLPLNYDETTLQTIEQIDVIWLKGRSMARAFEIEHTTAVYSGLLRMADLLALQPNMNIRLHIVAPEERGEKVLREIKRPVFSLLEHGPLYKKCTFITYDSINDLVNQKKLEHMNESIIETYEESAED